MKKLIFILLLLSNCASYGISEKKLIAEKNFGMYVPLKTVVNPHEKVREFKIVTENYRDPNRFLAEIITLFPRYHGDRPGKTYILKGMGAAYPLRLSEAEKKFIAQEQNSELIIFNESEDCKLLTLPVPPESKMGTVFEQGGVCTLVAIMELTKKKE